MIQFFRGLKAKYNYPTNTNLTDAIYFATDTQEILVNGTSYGGGISNVSLSNENILTFTKADGSSVTIDLNDTLYISSLDDDVAMVDAVGGIAAGTTVAQLSKLKTVSEMFDELLFPTVQPTAIAPTASLSLKNYAATQEVGAAAPTEANFTKSWNQGQIKIGNTVKSTRAGAMTSEKLYYGTSEDNAVANLDKVPAGATSYYYRVYYAEGPQPLDSKGNNATSISKLAAGNVTSSAVTVNGVYPFYGNVNSSTAFAKLALTTATSFTQKLAAENPGKHTFKLPHNITKFEALNTLSNQYEVVDSSKFTKTTEQIDVNGNSVQYNVYTRNDAGYVGEVTYRITYTK